MQDVESILEAPGCFLLRLKKNPESKKTEKLVFRLELVRITLQFASIVHTRIELT